jgi:SAM-dependent methyltransferase
MLFTFKQIIKRKSFARALFNAELPAISLRGHVLDVGGGKHQDYLELVQKEKGTFIDTVDIAVRGQSAQSIDFEKDPLPFATETFDQVLVFNVLEHIYNHNFLVGEIGRVLKDGGQLIGFVPFLVNYHPDPHDYFRYTKEALKKILESKGFSRIHILEVGRGPFAVNYNNLIFSFPLVVAAVLFPFQYIMDTLFLMLRPGVRQRYPLGYIFTAKK